MGYFQWAPYVPVAERKKQAEKEIAALKKKGRVIAPVEITGRTIASTFWGKSWCDHLESYSDYANRLPRGRTYVRNGSVVHLGVAPGKIDALVRGSSMYTVTVSISRLPEARWGTVVGECAGKIDSLVELLKGKLSKGVMEIVTHRERGLFPSPKEIKLDCSCPDSATMCKHVAAVLYGVGARLDREPELLFRLRDVDPAALFAKSIRLPSASKGRAKEKSLGADSLGAMFGIEIDDGVVASATVATAAEAKPVKSAAKKASASKSVAKRAAKTSKAAAENSKTGRAKKVVTPAVQVKSKGKSVAAAKRPEGTKTTTHKTKAGRGGDRLS